MQSASVATRSTMQTSHPFQAQAQCHEGFWRRRAACTSDWGSTSFHSKLEAASALLQHCIWQVMHTQLSHCAAGLWQAILSAMPAAHAVHAVPEASHPSAPGSGSGLCSHWGAVFLDMQGNTFWELATGVCCSHHPCCTVAHVQVKPLAQTLQRWHDPQCRCGPGCVCRLPGNTASAGSACALREELMRSGCNEALRALLHHDVPGSCAHPMPLVVSHGPGKLCRLSHSVSSPAGSADALREEVMRSSWYEAFRTDMRSSVVVRAVEDSLGRVGSATVAATSWTTTRLALTGQGLRWGFESLLAGQGRRCDY